MLHLLALTGQTTDQSAPVGGVVLVAAAVAVVILFIAGAAAYYRTVDVDDDHVDDVEVTADDLIH